MDAYGYKGFSEEVPIEWRRLVSESHLYLKELGAGRYIDPDTDLPSIWIWSLQGPADGRPTIYGNLEIRDLEIGKSRITFSGMSDIVPLLDPDIRALTEAEFQEIVDGYFSMLKERFGYKREQTNHRRSKPARKKSPDLPSRTKDAHRWVLIWEAIEPKLKQNPSLKTDIHELIEYLKRNNDVDAVKEDTLKKIMILGAAGRMPSRLEFERKNKM